MNNREEIQVRHCYELQPETIKAINGHAQNVAEEMDVSDKHIYAILAGTETDPFSKFVVLFSAAVRAGCDVSPWLNRLEAVVGKYRNAGVARSPFECLADKITGDAVTTKKIVKSLEDGSVSDAEIAQIQTAIRAERRVLKELELGLFKVMKSEAA